MSGGSPSGHLEPVPRPLDLEAGGGGGWAEQSHEELLPEGSMAPPQLSQNFWNRVERTPR